jgi:2-keto-4-pentenoate hydratase
MQDVAGLADRQSRAEHQCRTVEPLTTLHPDLTVEDYHARELNEAFTTVFT